MKDLEKKRRERERSKTTAKKNEGDENGKNLLEDLNKYEREG